MSQTIVAAAVFAATASAVKLADMEQGAEFTKCMSLTDFQTKTLHDDITLIDRDATTLCCPTGSAPGMKYYPTYAGPQVACGFTADGSISFKTNGDTCEYNKCYVVKQDVTCKDDSKQLLNGCCGPEPMTKTTKATMFANFDDKCSGYFYNNIEINDGEKSGYCLTYQKTGYKMLNTANKADDQNDGKLQVDKLYEYTPCPTSQAGGTAGSATAAPATADDSSPAGLTKLSSAMLLSGMGAATYLF